MSNAAPASTGPWHRDSGASPIRLETRELSGILDVARPRDGLRATQLAGAPLPNLNVLGVELDVAAASEIEDSYCRLNDVVAIYSAVARRPTRVAVYWRLARQPHPGIVASVDLQVSIQTDQLDSHPQIGVVGSVPSEEVWHLANPIASHWQQLPPSEHARLDASSGTGCIAARLAGAAAWYVEMVHPADLVSVEIEPAPQRCTWRRRLFARWLEKGVILRGRVRGLWLSGELDRAGVLTAYQAFSQEDPPLAT